MNTPVPPRFIHIISCKLYDILEYRLMLRIQRLYNEDDMTPEGYIRILDEQQDKALHAISTYQPSIDALSAKIAQHFILRHPGKKTVDADTLELYSEDAVEVSPEFNSTFETLFTNIVRELD